MSVDELRQRIKVDGVEFIYAMFVEMHGKPCAKLVPVTQLDDLMENGAGFAGFAAGPIGQTPADPDIIAIPDPTSYMVLPWQPNIAAMQCDPTVGGQDWPFAPRVILKQVLKAAADRNLVLKVGVEAEYSLVSKNADGTIRVADERDTSGAPCYDARGLTRLLDHLTAVSRQMDALGWGNYANDHEDANGQFEQNFEYADAMVTADRLIILRLMIHHLAEQQGIYATFMPKPFNAKSGNGLHTHLSLWTADTDEPLFHDEDDKRGLGLSPMAYHFLAGILEHAAGLAAFICPSVNSYKRLGAAAPDSGANWAPVFAIYGGNNRTQMIRVPEGGRIEVRAVDGAANPYLAMAAQLVCGLAGIDSESDPGEPNTENLYELNAVEAQRRGIATLPRTLWHAADALESDAVLRTGMGSTPGGDYVDYFVDVKRREFMDWHDGVTQAEVDQYLSLC